MTPTMIPADIGGIKPIDYYEHFNFVNEFNHH